MRTCCGIAVALISVTVLGQIPALKADRVLVLKELVLKELVLRELVLRELVLKESWF